MSAIDVMYPFMEMPLGVTERESRTYRVPPLSLITSRDFATTRVYLLGARALRTRHAPGFSDVYITITKD